MYQMSPRERILTALAIKKPDRVPKDAWFTPHIIEKFREHTGAQDPAQYYDFEHRNVGFGGTKIRYDFSRYFPNGLPPGTGISEWGDIYISGSSFS